MISQRILFVCLGNICRSPAADGILRDMALRNGVDKMVEIDSAGTYGGHAGQPSDARMREAAYCRGYRLTHRSRQITQDDFFDFDRIIVMDDNNLRDVERLAPSPETKAKIERFADLVRNIPDIHYVPDPYYEGREGFYHVLDILEDGCQTIIESLTATTNRE
ncbi:MAG: low molecular weight protein-tyrosine-phosphatase [Rikenellaceae bacterium]